MTVETKWIRNGTSKRKLLMLDSWRITPFRYARMGASDRFSSVSIHGPMGAKVLNDFARVHCPSFRWRSRAVTSLQHTYPRIYRSALSAGTALAVLFMTI